ncbi:hypothetical protein BU26DRAFT_211120 [Trematosphaeria pertusa]|uniref:RING-type domain-containing protein n=1 Tax=Trematosphaeria pertusa TaxID=390896 RepID=A0A6A6ITH1_9PLEO|nr:uncharacterized protein BU26DRAFT_211120 [Trematosphaeria pertusa]KAF2252890.1 hypothetical protein BU26DRAFT_211120 [Trematosphaeria pertusa]
MQEVNEPHLDFFCGRVRRSTPHICLQYLYSTMANADIVNTPAKPVCCEDQAQDAGPEEEDFMVGVAVDEDTPEDMPEDMPEYEFRTKDEFIENLEPLTCSLCLEKYGNDHVPVELPDCGHVFGDHCIIQWFETESENNNKCPLCRNELFEQEDFDMEDDEDDGDAAGFVDSDIASEEEADDQNGNNGAQGEDEAMEEDSEAEQGDDEESDGEGDGEGDVSDAEDYTEEHASPKPRKAKHPPPGQPTSRSADGHDDEQETLSGDEEANTESHEKPAEESDGDLFGDDGIRRNTPCISGSEYQPSEEDMDTDSDEE